MRTTMMITCAVLSMVVAGPAMADWNPGDPHKMHFPQLPDPEGWDVNATNPKVLADDWQCSETGRVTDIHVWGSWEQDIVAPIASMHVSIHSNIPADPIVPYSRPGQLLWERDFDPSQFVVIDPWGTGEQGWYNPNTGEWRRSDHLTFHQINIEKIEEPFVQEEGEIYWLDVSVAPLTPSARWGWKTSRDHFMDDAVWTDVGTQFWEPLFDPITGESLDLAFVITPEPAMCLLFALGGLMMMRRRTAK